MYNLILYLLYEICVDQKKVIKSNLPIKILAIFAFLLFLFVPSKIVQSICIGFDLTVIFSYFYALILLKNLDAERSINNLKVASKEQIEIKFSVLNRCRLPALVCFVQDTISMYVFGDENNQLISLRPYERTFIKYKVMAKERGLFTAGPVVIKSSDPIGFFQITKEVPVFNTIMVRPAKINLITKPIPGRPQGVLSIQNKIYEDITLRRSIRPYQTGDELKRINWYISAKYNSLFTNEYENSFDVPFFVFLNLAEDDYTLDLRHSKGETAIEIAAAIVEASKRFKQPCGFAAYGTDFPFLMPRQNQSESILDALSLIKMVPGKLDYNPIEKLKTKLSKNTQIFVIGPDEVDHYINLCYADEKEITTKKLNMEKVL